ncbi:MAG: outer membrane protein transport protein, partial [Myxococcota bacterium]
MRRRLTWILAAASLLAPSGARASGLSAPNVGSTKSGVVCEDAAAVYWNPAMLARLKRRQIMFGANLIAADIRYQRERLGTYQRADSFDFQLPIDPTRVDLSKTGAAEQVRTNPVAPAPSGFAALPLTDRLTLGLAAYAPIAAILNFDPEGAQRFSLQRAVLLTTNLTVAAGWEANRWLSLGAGGTLIIGYAELDRVQDFSTIGAVGQALARPPIEQPNDFGPEAPVGVRELDVMARPVRLQRALGRQATFHAGALVALSETLDAGVSYQHSAPMDFVGTFTLDMDDDFFTQDLATQGLQYDPRIEGDASLSFTLPRAVHLGLDWRPSSSIGLTMLAQWTAWSQVEAFDVRLSSPQLEQPELGLPSTAQIELPRRWGDTL